MSHDFIHMIAVGFLLLSLFGDIFMSRWLFWYYGFKEGNTNRLTQWFTSGSTDGNAPWYKSAAWRTFLDAGYKIGITAMVGWASYTLAGVLNIYPDYLAFIPVVVALPFARMAYRCIGIVKAQRKLHPNVK